MRDEPRNVIAEFLFRCAFGSSAHDHTAIGGDDLAKDRLEARTLSVRKLSADSGHRTIRDVDQESTRQRNLGGESCALVPHGIFAYLNQNRIAWLQREFDALGLAFEAGGIPVDLTCVEHGVATTADIDERGFHAWEHVLHAPQIHVADHRSAGVAVDIVLNQNAVFENCDLSAVFTLTNNHHAINCLTTSEELSLSEDRGASTSCLTAFTSTLLLSLESG